MLTTIVARLSDRLPENAPGDFFVDSSCIDCATCRTLAPRVFARSDAIGLSVVGCQPSSAADALRAKMALVSCPTSAIGTASKVDAAANPTYKAGQQCGTCAQFTGKAGATSGGCNIFVGHTVPSTGWCKVWAQKS